MKKVLVLSLMVSFQICGMESNGEKRGGASEFVVMIDDKHTQAFNDSFEEVLEKSDITMPRIESDGDLLQCAGWHPWHPEIVITSFLPSICFLSWYIYNFLM